MKRKTDAWSRRDAETMRILGTFFVILGSLVLVGTFWALDNFRATIVNLGSGFVLAGIGVAMVFVSRFVNRKKLTAKDAEK
jgi:predicted phage tail protein